MAWDTSLFSREITELDPLTLTTGRFAPGSADRFLVSQASERKMRIGVAELFYYRGEIGEAMRRFEQLRDSDDVSELIAEVLCRTNCLLAQGDVQELIDIFENARIMQESLPKEAPLRRLSEYLLLYFNILLHNVPGIRFPQVGVHAFAVPESLKTMAFYVYSHYLMELGDVGRGVGMAETALLMSDETCPVPEIYLSLMICCGYMLRAEWDKAQYYFCHAWDLAKPDGLIMPFAEHRRMLFGMLEKCLRYSEPEYYKRIQDLANTYHKHWVIVHNTLTGDRITNELTAIEYNVAKLARMGMVNQEIADFAGISVNSVRAHLRNIFNKLGIDSRKELAQFVL